MFMDGIMMKMVFSSNPAENHYSIHQSQNETLSAGNTTTFTETTSLNDDFYVEIKRTGSTTAEMSFYSDSNYSTLVENKTLTIDNITGLRYLGVRTNGDASTVSGQAIGWIDDVEFYNAVTSVPSTTHNENLVDGSIFYTTDTNKEYVLYNNTWTEV